jgi:hypothetical protein
MGTADGEVSPIRCPFLFFRPLTPGTTNLSPIEQVSLNGVSMFRILRGLGSRTLSCGCLVGFYETYASDTVAILDARGSNCPALAHRVGGTVDVPAIELAPQAPSTMPTMNR